LRVMGHRGEAVFSQLLDEYGQHTMGSPVPALIIPYAFVINICSREMICLQNRTLSAVELPDGSVLDQACKQALIRVGDPHYSLAFRTAEKGWAQIRAKKALPFLMSS